MSTDEAMIESAAREISAALGETQPGAIRQIEQVVRLQGVEWAQALQSEVAQIEAQGGMLRPDGQRRTPGGAFLHLAYQRMKAARSSEPGPRLTPVGSDPAQPLVWNDRLEAVSEAAQEKGQLMGVKIQLAGRPGRVSRRNDTVVLVIEDSHFGTLPKTVPPPPATPTLYTVYVAARQWAQVETAIKNPEDVLIIDGYCAYDEAVKGITVFATHVATKLTKIGSRRPAAKPPRRPVQTLTAVSASSAPKPAPAPPAPKPVPVPPDPLSPARYKSGQQVKHAQFGVGQVVSSDVVDGVEKVYVDFVDAGLKRVSADTLTVDASG